MTGPEDITCPQPVEARGIASLHHYERVVAATRSFMFTVFLEKGRPVQTLYYQGSREVTGFARQDYAADPQLWFAMIVEEDRALVHAQIADVFRAKKACAIEHRIRHKDGAIRWIRNTSVPTLDENGEMTGYDGLITDITELKMVQLHQKELLDEMRRIAVRDALTGLFNRLGFEEELQRAWNLGEHHGLPAGLLFMDIDHFKVYNDTYGHAVGDQILKEASRVITSTMRASDVVCRCGGDEIAVICLLQGAEETRQAAERLIEAFRQHVFCRETHGLHVTLSIGASVGRAEEETPQKMVIRVDQALYRAKREGRDRLCFSDTHADHDHVEIHDPSLRIEVAREQEGELPEFNGTALIVDDDASSCAFLKATLEKEEYDVLTAGSAAALQVARESQGRIDIALVDIRLPDEDGFEVLRELHRMDEAMAVILITGHATLETAVKAMRQTATDFLEKPFSREEISTALKRAMRHRVLLQENRRYRMHLEQMVEERSEALTRALDQIRQSSRRALELMAAMIGIRENETAEHSRRVALMAEILAREMGLCDEDAKTVGHGALLHDIGKIGIPDAILLKPSPLTSEEWKIMRTHPQLGYNIVSTCQGFPEAAKIVLSHQEYFDGRGYPRGLKGDEICLGARVFAVADAYDAIRSPRMHAPGQSAEDAIHEITRCKGTQFDPDVVDAFLRCQPCIEACTTEEQEDGRAGDAISQSQTEA